MYSQKIRMPQISSTTASDTFEGFLLTKRAKGAKTKTLETYRHHFRAIGHHLDTSLNISELDKNKYEQMISSMIKSGLSPNSIRSYTVTLRAFLSWCNEEGLTNFRIKAFKGVDTIKETYTDSEIEVLLKKPNMKTCSFPEYRTWVIINVLVNNGCRASMIRNIRNDDVDLNTKLIQLRHLKSRKVQAVPLCDALCVILKDYMRVRGGSREDYLFPAETGIQLSENALASSIERYNKKRGVERTSIHAFRHTFAKKFLLDCGGNALMLQKLLNHSTLDMTKHYCAIFDADVVKGFEQVSPLARLCNSNRRIKMRQ